MAGAGQFIYDVFQRRGVSLYRLGNIQETAEMNLLFDDLATPAARDALRVIGADGWLDELRGAQDAFETTYHQKVETESQEDLPLLRAATARLSDHVNALLGCLGVLHEFAELNNAQAELTTLDELVGKIDEIITQVMTVARARRTRQSNVVSSVGLETVDSLATTAGSR